MNALASRAVALLARHTRAVALADEVPWPVEYVITVDGSGLLMAVPDRDMLDAATFVLHIPDETLELGNEYAIAMVTLTNHDGRGADRARWEAYHTEPPTERWVLAHIDALRALGEVFDGESLDLSNPLWGEQQQLCAHANRDPARLALAVAMAGGVHPDEARAVGVDAWGVDVRGAFGVHRLEFPTRTADTQQALENIDAALELAI